MKRNKVDFKYKKVNVWNKMTHIEARDKKTAESKTKKKWKQKEFNSKTKNKQDSKWKTVRR